MFGGSGQRLFDTVVARNHERVHRAQAPGTGRCGLRQVGGKGTARRIVSRTACPPACEPGERRLCVGEQRAERHIVARGGICQSPPSQCEIHALALEQGKPIVRQRRVGGIICRPGMQKAEFGALAGKQGAGVAGRERIDHCAGFGYRFVDRG